MKNKILESISAINKAQDDQLKKLHAIVDDAIQEETLIIHSLQHPAAEYLSPGQKLSDKVAFFGGSWRFIIVFGVVIFVWIFYNVYVVKDKQFDPYPFILMNLVLSCVAALQAPVIMMSQNRKEEKDRKRAENDYLINLKAEIEIRNLHQKINLLMEEQIHKLIETQAVEIKLLNDIQAKLGL
ncbi:MAG: DUF1003 domain-containing protein [Ignavibacteria bacterium]|nr:DUF1003 domain-containing protein [Ignavibacteria bacterium]